MLRTKLMTGVIVLLAGAAVAREQPVSPPPESLAQMATCRQLAAVGERALCYDRAFDAFEAAQRSREVVVVNRKDVVKARRSLFGLNLPKLDLFTRDETKEEAAAFETLDTKIASASQSGNGRWAFVLEDGARWVQNDDEPVASPPRAGAAIRIRRGAVGGYLANVAGQRAIRVRRIN